MNECNVQPHARKNINFAIKFAQELDLIRSLKLECPKTIFGRIDFYHLSVLPKKSRELPEKNANFR
jgi:hypothetical protein